MSVAVEQMASIRERMLPMLAYAQSEYGYRVPAGYPVIHDDVARGVIGIEIDPGHSLYLSNEGDNLYADVTYRSSRYDTRSSAGREKFAGRSIVDRRPLPWDVSDQTLRNLIAELMSRWNSQQTLIYFTDT